MIPDTLRSPVDAWRRATSVEPRLAGLFCLLLLAGSCALASFAFACATPFAAFAVVAAAMLPLRPALLVVAVAWVVNQAIGFGAHGYPYNLNTVLWGFAIGAAALLSTVAAKTLLHSRSGSSTLAALGLATLVAYAVYELVLFAFTPFLGGAGAFTLAIVARLGLLNILWLIGLIIACGLFGMLMAMSPRRQMS
jgi:hypothetical protein